MKRKESDVVIEENICWILVNGLKNLRKLDGDIFRRKTWSLGGPGYVTS